MKFDITETNTAVERLLEKTENPRHRYLLTAYNRHRYLEMAGRYAEIFTPEMTVEHPVYRFALFGLQERGTMFIGPGEDVYEGMIVGENARADDLDVNATKEKHQTNVRAASADVLVRLIPHKLLSLEQAIEFLRDDECVEITPASIRLRKEDLSKTERVRAARRARAAAD